MRINLATSTDDKYARYAFVMIVSALENKLPGDEICFYLMNSGLQKRYLDDFKELEKEYEGFIFSPLYIDSERFSKKLPVDEKWPIAIYYRLMLPDILPEDVSRLIYTDVDVIINKPLNDLFDIDLEGKLICACEDYGTDEEAARSVYMIDHLLQKGKKYYNSGVLMLDIAGLKAQYSFDDYMKTAMELLDRLHAPDQDVINYVHQDEIKEIDKNIYNMLAKRAYADGMKLDEICEKCSIIHYANQKPWSGKFIHCDTEILWWNYARLTPYKEELTEEFMNECLGDPYVYDLVTDLMIENKKLKEEVELRKQLNEKLLSIVEGK